METIELKDAFKSALVDNAAPGSYIGTDGTNLNKSTAGQLASVVGGLNIYKYKCVGYPLIQITDNLKDWNRFWCLITGVNNTTAVLSIVAGYMSGKNGLTVNVKHLAGSSQMKFYTKGNAVFVHFTLGNGVMNESVCILTDSFIPVIVANTNSVDESYNAV